MAIHSTPQSGYFAGQLLIATPGMEGGCFDKSVVYLCEHSAGGAMGLIVNHPLKHITLGAIFQELGLVAEREVAGRPVYFGGPVEPQRGFIVHTTDLVLQDSVVGEGGIALTANVGMLRGMAAGHLPQYSFLALGYAGWGAGQLEAEMEAGSWISVPATRQLVFETENELKWTLSAASLGVDLSRLSTVVGHA